MSTSFDVQFVDATFSLLTSTEDLAFLDADCLADLSNCSNYSPLNGSFDKSFTFDAFPDSNALLGKHHNDAEDYKRVFTEWNSHLVQMCGGGEDEEDSFQDLSEMITSSPVLEANDTDTLLEKFEQMQSWFLSRIENADSLQSTTPARILPKANAVGKWVPIGGETKMKAETADIRCASMVTSVLPKVDIAASLSGKRVPVADYYKPDTLSAELALQDHDYCKPIPGFCNIVRCSTPNREVEHKEDKLFGCFAGAPAEWDIPEIAAVEDIKDEVLRMEVQVPTSAEDDKCLMYSRLPDYVTDPGSMLSLKLPKNALVHLEKQVADRPDEFKTLKSKTLVYSRLPDYVTGLGKASTGDSVDSNPSLAVFANTPVVSLPVVNNHAGSMETILRLPAIDVDSGACSHVPDYVSQPELGCASCKGGEMLANSSAGDLKQLSNSPQPSSPVLPKAYRMVNNDEEKRSRHRRRRKHSHSTSRSRRSSHHHPKYMSSRSPTRSQSSCSMSSQSSDYSCETNRSSYSRKSGSRTSYSHKSRSRSPYSRARSSRSRSPYARSRRSRSRSLYSSSRGCRSRSPDYKNRTSSNNYRSYSSKWYSENGRQRSQETISEERRIVYIGRIEDGTTRDDLRRRFGKFGPIEDVKLHFRDYGDNYGFVTFVHKYDANEAIKNGNNDITQTQYDLSFGGRRSFCKADYADLDSVGNILAITRLPAKKEPSDFDALLHMAMRRK